MHFRALRHTLATEGIDVPDEFHHEIVGRAAKVVYRSAADRRPVHEFRPVAPPEIQLLHGPCGGDRGKARRVGGVAHVQGARVPPGPGLEFRPDRSEREHSGAGVGGTRLHLRVDQ